MFEKAKLYVIDDDQAMRDSLAFLLGSAGFSVLAFPAATSFLEALPTLEAACVLTDIRMPDVDGIELIRRLRAGAWKTPVIVMTGHGDVPLAVEAMKLGAFDFIEKPFDDEVLIRTLHSAIQTATARVQADSEEKDLAERVQSLTPRERQVLDALVAGHANKVIGRDLAISPRTVEIYRANVMTKMRVASLSELVRIAIRMSLA